MRKTSETIAGIICGNGERIRLANEIITKRIKEVKNERKNKKRKQPIG